MPVPFDLFHHLNFSMLLPQVQGTLKGTSPYILNIQDSFSNKAAPFYQWIFLVLAVIGCAIMVNAAVKFKTRKKRTALSPEGGQELFETTLAHLDLSAFDRSLLKQVAGETRLRHPCVFLLSPDLFNWSQKIWVQEKGIEHVTAEKLERMDCIRHKLFGTTTL